MSLRMVGSLITRVPPSPMTSSMTPCRPRKNASVTTKLGIRSRATSRPIRRPMTTPVARAARTPSSHGQPCWVIVTASTAAQVPAAKPTERSISPSSRTNTRPMAMTMTRGALVDQVGEVERGREGGAAHDREQDDEGDQPEHGGQRTHVTAADAVPVPGPGVAQVVVGTAVLGCDLGGGRRGAHAGSSSAGTGAMLSVSPGEPWMPWVPLRPAVISSTTWEWVTSLARTCAAIRPR